MMKKPYGFEVRINDKLICKAGFEDVDSVVTCMLSNTRRDGDEKDEVELSVGGLISETEQQVSWFKNSNLKEGDKVSFEVITHGFNKPKTKTRKVSDANKLINKLKQFKSQKEELEDFFGELGV